MTSFRSPEELFQAVRELVAELEGGGHGEAAAELRSGFGCLNGLTDGWALFLASIDRVQARHARRFTDEERKALDAIRTAADYAVYRG